MEKEFVRTQSFSEVTAIVSDRGYAIVPDALDRRELSFLLDALPDLEPHRSRAGVRHVLCHPHVTTVANHPKLREIAEAVLGNSAIPFRATLFDKSPDSNWLVAWHQDTALPLREKIEKPGWGPWSIKEGVIYAHAPTRALGQVLALRLHLDDSTAQNGPLRVLPGTHTRGVLSDDQVEQLAKQNSQETCMVPAGGVLAMRPLLIHASSKTQVDASRRVLHIEYAASVEIDEGLHLAEA
jgi:ectoine hydroxylase-related dioxygenase (phytanoyl-CoA dioxygenase family)